ncbi:MAG TPA: hypothetical protein EYQ73_05735 [Candidatus Poseidoniales archaeon]|nr:hypothetical protein [Candidatus Poseidoniales archaeon]
MATKSLRAIILASIMVLSGCLGAVEKENSQTPIVKTPVVSLNIDSITDGIVGQDHTIAVRFSIDQSGIESTKTVEFISDDGYTAIEYQLVDYDGGFYINWVPTLPGVWAVMVIIEVNGIREPFTNSGYLMVESPDEGPTVLSLETIHEVEADTPLSLDGVVNHSTVLSCELITDDGKTADVDEQGGFSLNLGIIEESQNFVLTATCGKWTKSNDSRTIHIIVSSGDDADGDGISDDDDACPNGFGEDDGWVPNPTTDRDSDGCHDFEEDPDDDNDLIPDSEDNCASDIGWVSDSSNDYDSDGCADNSEDDDDDNDGISDADDDCPLGFLNWESTLYTDWDHDGCNDFEEDLDDDNDSVLDLNDSCWRGQKNWQAIGIDFDSDGCEDGSEDEDDDNDGINDVNGTGVILDLCPQTPQPALEVDENGCAASELDSDSDGITDDIDACPGTPSGNAVNEFGCADLDGDGIFSNVDNCPDSMAKWTVNQFGCAVYQQSQPWKTSGYGSGRMDIVKHFSLPTLDSGTWSFQNQWTGDDTYLFLFKYTDTSGNSNNGDWGANPTKLVKSLPENAHIFFGSFDSTFHNDVLGRKNAVLNGLSTAEEEKIMPRVHFIDMDMSGASGGIGDLINSWGSFYYGIDRFQRARETGSLSAWTSGGNDISHWAYESQMWNYEFMSEIRETDPAIDVITIVEEEWHSGGWSSGYRSTYSDINITLPNNISSYDTLEVFHEHGCEDRRNRHSGGGCHEWDYLAYLKICDRDNSTICGTEFMRWITTYGREGRWLTDISPYLFMLDDGDTRSFKYEGANKGLMTIKLLFSDWGSGYSSSSGEKIFSGGEFDGDYNNESKYKRQHNFSTLTNYDKVKIVATITGHGFNQDQANCAEFCDHEHHYYLNGNHAYEWHPIVHDNEGCENDIENGVVANQYGSWPYGRAGWCAGQDVDQWTYDITSWVDNSTTNNLVYKGLFNGQEYNPQDTNGGSRQIRANIWLVYYDQTG